MTSHISTLHYNVVLSPQAKMVHKSFKYEPGPSDVNLYLSTRRLNQGDHGFKASLDYSETLSQTNKRLTYQHNKTQTKLHWVLRDQVRYTHFKATLMASLQAERPLLPNTFLEHFILKQNHK